MEKLVQFCQWSLFTPSSYLGLAIVTVCQGFVSHPGRLLVGGTWLTPKGFGALLLYSAFRGWREENKLTKYSSPEEDSVSSSAMSPQPQQLCHVGIATRVLAEPPGFVVLAPARDHC